MKTDAVKIVSTEEEHKQGIARFSIAMPEEPSAEVTIDTKTGEIVGPIIVRGMEPDEFRRALLAALAQPVEPQP